MIFVIVPMLGRLLDCVVKRLLNRYEVVFGVWNWFLRLLKKSLCIFGCGRRDPPCV